MLENYTGQGVSVERGFRFLKDPLFFADSLFLKKPERIMALMMIMGLALLIYALAERRLHLTLEKTNGKIPDQKGKPTATPTIRWVFQPFEGIDILTVCVNGQPTLRQGLTFAQFTCRSSDYSDLKSVIVIFSTLEVRNVGLTPPSPALRANEQRHS